ncbi:serine/threonine-protein kinase [Sorangium cellulosum]|uniref:serine/threonine-protein kinase n=1 Tax=Sorangium cellulosum TaxID=56 RepID=UPI0013316200|nr:serine/threonine-protein kinase [Sorangium cellulosum]
MAKDPWSDWNDDDPGNFQPGDTIGPYELLFPAAVGGMAAVWAARLRRPNGTVQIVAVKLLSDAMRGDDDARAMFLDEACTASRILHPNVVHILAYGEVRDRPYLAMEWIDGAPIAKIFSNQKAKRALLPLGWVLHVMTAACAGLHAAHEVRDDTGELLNLIHRDVTPENVMVTFDGMVKVVDFGVAKTRARAQISRVGAIKGKTGYFSPEQVMGGALDRRSDLFSMGVLLYLLVTGHTPFRGKGPLEAMQQIANRNPQPPREIMPEVHPELDRIIMRALAKNPNDRYQTAAELRRDLEQVSLAVRESYTDKQVGQLVRDLLPGVAEARKERIDQAIDELDKIIAERNQPHKPQAARPEDATEVMLRRISMLPILQDGPEAMLEEGAAADATPPSSGAGPASSRMSGPASSRMSGPASSRMSGPTSSRMAGPTSSRKSNPDATRKSNPDASRKSHPDATATPIELMAGLQPMHVGQPALRVGQPAHGAQPGAHGGPPPLRVGPPALGAQPGAHGGPPPLRVGPPALGNDPTDVAASLPEAPARPAPAKGSFGRNVLIALLALSVAAIVSLLLIQRAGVQLPGGLLPGGLLPGPWGSPRASESAHAPAAEVPDAGASTAAAPDAASTGAADAAAAIEATADAAVADAAAADMTDAAAAAAADAGVADAGVADAGVADAGVADAGMTDAAAPIDAAAPFGRGQAPYAPGAVPPGTPFPTATAPRVPGPLPTPSAPATALPPPRPSVQPGWTPRPPASASAPTPPRQPPPIDLDLAPR